MMQKSMLVLCTDVAHAGSGSYGGQAGGQQNAKNLCSARSLLRQSNVAPARLVDKHSNG